MDIRICEKCELCKQVNKASGIVYLCNCSPNDKVICSTIDKCPAADCLAMTDEEALYKLRYRLFYYGVESYDLVAISALRERIERNNGWISVEDALPEPETDVLVSVERKMVYSNQPVKKCRFVAKAFHEDGTINTEESLYCWNEMRSRWEHIESEDAYRIPEGWFESVSYEDEFNAIDDFVTHWIPLPAPPKEENK